MSDTPRNIADRTEVLLRIRIAIRILEGEQKAKADWADGATQASEDSRRWAEGYAYAMKQAIKALEEILIDYK